VANTKRVIIPYAPRRVFLPYHDRTQRFAVGVAHRRCGKTVAAVNDKIRRAVSTDKSMYRGAYIAPFLRQAKDVAWEYLKKYAAPVLSRPPNESELWVEVMSSGGPARIRIYGADNADALRGGYLDDATLDEFADMRPGVWGEIIRPMLADRHGSATFIGTPKGRNAFFDIYDRAGQDQDNWFRFFLPASKTGILPQSELDAARRDMTPEQYDQEFECSFEAAILGAYYGREMSQAEREGRLRSSLSPAVGPIHCAWDFGNGANMAIWAFEVTPDGPVVHDFIQASGWYFEDYLKEVARRGYDGNDYVPHDARVPSFETGRTRIETMLAFKRKPVLVVDLGVDDGINAGKIILRRAVFNSTTCAAGLEALRQYRQDWDEKARVFRPVPKHDWASHPADAWRYLSVAWREHIAPIAADVVPLFKPLEQLTVKQFIEIETDHHDRRERV
jgi:phage terminase large subunit